MGPWVEGRELWDETEIQISQNLAENVDYTRRHPAEGGAIVFQ